MNWVPISKNDLEKVIAQEVSRLPEDLQVVFSKIRTLKKIKCLRSAKHGVEDIAIVAELKNHIVLFDDVEDEFALSLAPIKKDEVLREWELFPDLKSVLQKILTLPSDN